MKFLPILLGISILPLSSKEMPTLTLNKALEAAYKNNTDIHSKRAALSGVYEKGVQGRSGFRPTITISASGTSAAQRTKPGRLNNLSSDGERNQGLSAEAQISQNIFAGGSDLASARSADALVAESQENYFSEEQKIILEAIRAYLEVIQRREAVQYLKDSKRRLEKTLKAVQAKFSHGESPQHDVDDAKGRLEAVKAQLASQEVELVSVEAKFERLTGLSAAQQFKMPNKISLPKEISTLLNKVKANNPSILKARHALTKNQEQILVEGGRYLPQISVFGKGTRSKNAERKNSSDRKTYYTNNLTLGVKAELTLYQGGALRSKKREAVHNKVAAKKALLEAIKKVVESTLSVRKNYKVSEHNTQRYYHQIKAFEAVLKGRKEEFKAGTQDIFKVLEAENALLNPQLNYLEARKNYYLNAYKLKALEGNLNPKTLKVNVAEFNPKVDYCNTKYSF